MICTKCQKEKELSEFYIHPTNGKPRRKCKECFLEQVKLWWKKNPEEVKQIQKRYRENNRENQARYYREWYKKNGRSRATDYAEKNNIWRKENLQKAAVSQRTRTAIRDGKIERPKYCFYCKEDRRLLAHHPDYSLPFSVQFICSSCHKLIHNGRGVKKFSLGVAPPK